MTWIKDSMSITIYHNPRCSKSRQALQLLLDHDLNPTVVDYLHTPPSREELERILDLLNMEPEELLRKQELEYKEAGLDDPLISREALIDAMIENPILIQRPIVIANGKAVIGRPPERVLDIL